MTETLLTINIFQIGVLVALVGWIGKRMILGLEVLGNRFDVIARLHLRHHPEDLDHFKIGGSE